MLKEFGHYYLLILSISIYTNTSIAGEQSGNSKPDCKLYPKYVNTEYVNTELEIPCLSVLIESLSNEIRRRHKPFKDNLYFPSGEYSLSRLIDNIGDLVRLQVKYTNENTSLEDAGIDSFRIVDEDNHEWESSIILEAPLNFIQENNRKRNRQLIDLYKLDNSLRNAVEDSKLKLINHYSDIEKLFFDHENCVCSRRYETNCHYTFYRLKEKVIQTFVLAKRDLNSEPDKIWLTAKPDQCSSL